MGLDLKEYLQSVEGGEDLIVLTQQQATNTQLSFTNLLQGVYRMPLPSSLIR